MKSKFSLFHKKKFLFLNILDIELFFKLQNSISI